MADDKITLCSWLPLLYLNILNIFALLLSLALIGYAGYLAHDLYHLHKVIHGGVVASPLAFGVIFFLVALLGLLATWFRSKVLLSIYLLFVIAATVALFVSGIVLLVFSGSLGGILNDIEASASYNYSYEEQDSDTLKNIFTDLELTLYNRCCSSVYGLPEAPLLEQKHYTEYNGQNISSDVCDQLGNVTVDIVDTYNVNDLGTDQDEVEKPLVGDPSEGGCGHGDPTLFVYVLSDLLQDYIYPLGVIIMCLWAILFLDILSCFVLLCYAPACPWNEKSKPVKKEPETNPPETEKTAKEIAYA